MVSCLCVCVFILVFVPSPPSSSQNLSYSQQFFVFCFLSFLDSESELYHSTQEDSENISLEFRDMIKVVYIKVSEKHEVVQRKFPCLLHGFTLEFCDSHPE